MTVKRKYPAPSFAEALKWLDRPMAPRVGVRVVLHPTKSEREVYASVELFVRTKMGGEIVCRRYGERAWVSSDDNIQGAVFRACMNAGLWLEERSPEDVLTLFLWETGVS